jgi:hypothetical protein
MARVAHRSIDSYPILSAGALTATLAVRETDQAGVPKPRLLDRVREAIRTRHYSRRTEKGSEGTVSLAMTKQERERCLADPHVGIISIPEDGRGPRSLCRSGIRTSRAVSFES